MSGPTGPNGTPGQTLLDEVRSDEVGSVLDLVGVNNIGEASTWDPATVQRFCTRLAKPL